jgi:trimethylamine:corrinoid methyltransferase-like protein
MVTSYETIVLDNERCGAIFRILEVAQVDADHLAFEVVADLVKGVFVSPLSAHSFVGTDLSSDPMQPSAQVGGE